jgi:hypothetical protein
MRRILCTARLSRGVFTQSRSRLHHVLSVLKDSADFTGQVTRGTSLSRLLCSHLHRLTCLTFTQEVKTCTFWCVETKLRSEVALRLCSRKLHSTFGKDRTQHSAKIFVQVKKTWNETRTVIDNQKQLPSPFTSRTSRQGKNLLEPMYLTAPCLRASVKLVVATIYTNGTQKFENETHSKESCCSALYQRAAVRKGNYCCWNHECTQRMR